MIQTPSFKQLFSLEFMTSQEHEPNTTSDHILDWLEESISSLPSILDDPYNSGVIDGFPWWGHGHDLDQDLFNYSTTTTPTTTTTTSTGGATLEIHLPPPDSTKKRKNNNQPLQKTSRRTNQSRRIDEPCDGEVAEDEVAVVAVKKTVGSKKASAKGGGNGNNCNNGNGRWAEQLLNPCAVAFTTGNLTRVQHLLFVLRELASDTGDANHRLAAHGLRALTHRLSSSHNNPTTSITFASTEPRFFQRSLLKFYEVSPWFAFPNNVANSSILQILAEESNGNRNLHIIDIGVSHGVQWPTLLEALTRRAGGPPPLVKLTVVAATVDSEQNPETPFSIGPQGDDVSSRLLRFAKSMNINLQINRLDNHPLQTLNLESINTSIDETLIVSAQFRLHHLNHHHHPEERTEFLKTLRKLNPKGVILSENNTDCFCENCGDFSTAFGRRVDYLWRFLDSTSAAFKGRESEERRVLEGEAAKVLTNKREMNEGKQKWCDRMRGVGFDGEAMGEDAIDGAKALLRKYDSNWEMRVDEGDGFLGLWWKGQPVSFCSLWKLGNDT